MLFTEFDRVRFQKGRGTRGPAAPKIGTGTWKSTAKVRKTSYSPSAQSGTPTYPACNFGDSPLWWHYREL